ncbi:hexosaminidase D isoform X1 [Photinus pyralis]|uniref:beta-N-acetylhexosaminidase n=1 Tax=Photinus pyralis TaxID=7054 RepID=A0A1Y1MQQ5_PHOPY|nr:hexosaminidase D isoform X1 [Photinus pyralis]
MNFSTTNILYNKKWRKVVYAVCLITLILLTILYFVPFQRRTLWKLGEYMSSKKHFELAEKIVHLDLKGAPPKVAYYKLLFPFLSQLGVTGLLIEYEDMFPYSGIRSKKIPARNAYSMENILTIRRLAKQSNLNVIPLVQVFGHMEFVLKLDDFAMFREVRKYPQMICPTHEVSPEIIVEMVEEIMKAHPDVDRLHIGADEVRYLGECDRCKDYIRSHGINTNELFLLYIHTIITKIRERYPALRILMWDDHFRPMTIEELQKSHIGGMVEPVVWNYHKDVDQRLDVWDKYAEIFPKVWVASAFKGATGPNQIIPDIDHHMENHKSWLKILSSHQDSVGFQGIILTGWQRYDHFSVLCELLPVGIPSLVACLQLLNPKDMINSLNCDSKLENCRFPGSDVYNAVIKYQELKLDLETFLASHRAVGWMDNYNVKIEYSNTYYIEQTSETIDALYDSLLRLKPMVYESMSAVYDNFTINEWCSVLIEPLSLKIKAIMKAKTKLLNVDHWSKRPWIKEDL